MVLSTKGYDHTVTDTFYGVEQNIGAHEEAHTYQYQTLGVFFLPAYFACGGISQYNPFEIAATKYAIGEGSWWP